VAKTIVLLATLDTKGLEADYLREFIQSRGYQTLLVDMSILNPVMAHADVPREEVAHRGGKELKDLVAAKNRDQSMEIMGEGAAKILAELYGARKLDGVLGIGGVQGTWLSTRAMQSLPIGVPKVVASATASGDIRPFIKNKDIAILFSVADILGGPNSVTKVTLGNAAAAVIGMVEAKLSLEVPKKKTLIGATAFGATTPAIMRCTQNLNKRGYEVVAFHANGACGAAMEELIEAGVIGAVLDLTTHELVSELYPVDIYLPVKLGRLEAAAKKGIPTIYAPGGTLGFIFGGVNAIPEKYRGRPTYQHNPSICVVSLNKEETRHVAEVAAQRLSLSTGPVKILVPMKGWWQLDRPGGPLENPEGIRIYLESFRKHLSPQIPYKEIDAHINDPEFADEATSNLLELIESKTK
jgi:uncharacterized protein (UPF0261 family)